MGPGGLLRFQVVVGIKPVEVTEWKGDILAIGIFEGEVETDEDASFKHPVLKRVDGFLGGSIADLIKDEEFTGKAGSSVFLRLSGYGFKKVGVIGLGKKDDVKTSTWKGFGEAIASATKSKATVGAAILSAKELSEDVLISAAGGIVSGQLLCMGAARPSLRAAQLVAAAAILYGSVFKLCLEVNLRCCW